MTTKSFSEIALSVVFALTARNLTAATAKEPDGDASPRLLRLAQDLQSGNDRALAIFWKELDSKAPLVESIIGDQRHRRVTFIWRGSNETTRVMMLRGLPGANLLKPFRRLADSDLRTPRLHCGRGNLPGC
jgi:hypothetical protein